MDTERKALLIEVFGESESSRSDEEEEPRPKSNRSWERFEEIKGLWLCRDFLSPQQQSSLLSSIHNEGWFSEASNNQAMRFGELPLWAIEISDSIRDVVLSSHQDVLDPLDEASTFPFPSHLLSRNTLFDQLIVNLYQPGEGICAHVDLMRFEDGIAIVSLESACVMHFSRVEGTTSDGDTNIPSMNMKIPLFFDPGFFGSDVWRSTLHVEARDKSEAGISEVERTGITAGEENLHYSEEAWPG